MPRGIPKNKMAKLAEEAEQEAMGQNTSASPAVAVEEPKVVETSIPGAVKEIPVDPEYNIEVIKDWHGNVDIFYLPKKDPRYEYRFLRADDKNLSIATGNMLFQGGGWQLCNKEHLKRIGIEDRYISPDGLHRRGDLILAFIPKHLHAEKVAMEVKKANQAQEAIDGRIKGGSTEGEGIHESMKGLQTLEQLGLK